jgi:putative protease
MVNNPGHFSLFRGIASSKEPGKIRLIAGPWLYTFNSGSLSFVKSLGVDAVVSPLENNRQNLEKTIKQCNTRQNTKALSSRFFVTVFSWPPLFNIRADIGSVFSFDSFTDNMGENFSLVTDIDKSSRVYPEKYFSIIDKIPFLKEAGFGRFIIDLSGRSIKKSEYKDLIRAVSENLPLPNSNRFNWKNGFFNPD